MYILYVVRIPNETCTQQLNEHVLMTRYGNHFKHKYIELSHTVKNEHHLVGIKCRLTFA